MYTVNHVVDVIPLTFHISPYRTTSTRSLMWCLSCDGWTHIVHRQIGSWCIALRIVTTRSVWKLTRGSEVISAMHASLCSTRFHSSQPETTTSKCPYIRSEWIQPYPVWLVLLFGSRFLGCTGRSFKKVWPYVCFFQIGSFSYDADVLCVVAKSVTGVWK